MLSREGSELEKWYSGPTLIDCLGASLPLHAQRPASRFVPRLATRIAVTVSTLYCLVIGVPTRQGEGRQADTSTDKVDVPPRPYDSPLRIPLSNVFKGQTAIASGVAVSGRLCSGVVQVGDRLRAVPGDEVAHVRSESPCDSLSPLSSSFLLSRAV